MNRTSHRNCVCDACRRILRRILCIFKLPLSGELSPQVTEAQPYLARNYPPDGLCPPPSLTRAGKSHESQAAFPAGECLIKRDAEIGVPYDLYDVIFCVENGSVTVPAARGCRTRGPRPTSGSRRGKCNRPYRPQARGRRRNPRRYAPDIRKGPARGS